MKSNWFSDSGYLVFRWLWDTFKFRGAKFWTYYQLQYLQLTFCLIISYGKRFHDIKKRLYVRRFIMPLPKLIVRNVYNALLQTWDKIYCPPLSLEIDRHIPVPIYYLLNTIWLEKNRSSMFHLPKHQWNILFSSINCYIELTSSTLILTVNLWTVA